MTMPSDQAEPERYRGRPLLIVLENYVLSALGVLGPDQDLAMRTVVQRVFGGDDDWRATVRTRLELGAALDDSLRAMWTTNTAIAQSNGATIVPIQFAKMIVDQNFAHLIAHAGE